MAKTRRLSGDLKMEVTFNDRSNQYQVKICPMKKGERCEKINVGAPKHLTTAVDSPAAITRAAHAAISFASDRIQDRAAPSRDGSGWDVRTPRRNKRS
jgi:hypothetical protein